ncbi:MAG: hypothetical protein V1808_04000 [Candidatus Daviesbacteria bacterium]
MYKEVFRPILDFLDATNLLPSDKAHYLVLNFFDLCERNPLVLKLFEKVFTEGGKRFVDPRLRVNLGQIELDNFLMVGAGWTKTGQGIKALYTLGTGAVFPGGTTLFNQEGNSGITQRMLSSDVSWNHIGLKNPGAEFVAWKLKTYQNSKIPIIANIAANENLNAELIPQALALTVLTLYPYVAGFEIDCSCPNLAKSNLFQDLGLLNESIQTILDKMITLGGYKDIFLKTSPDWNNKLYDGYIKTVYDQGLTGLTIANTTSDPNIKAKYHKSWAIEEGGAGGNDPDYRQKVLGHIAYTRRNTWKNFVINGVGGVDSWETAWEMLRAGANAIQLVTALRGEGPKVIDKIVRGVSQKMDEEGIKNLQEIVGLDAKKYLV